MLLYRQRNNASLKSMSRELLTVQPYFVITYWMLLKSIVEASISTLRSMLSKVKDTLSAEKQSKVVYQIPCSCGKGYVIGKTARRLEMKEHRDAYKKMIEKSAVASQHQMGGDFDS